MAIYFTNGAGTNLLDENRVNIDNSGSATSFTGEPGNGLAVDTDGQTIAIANGEVTVAESVQDVATYVSIWAPLGRTGFYVAPRSA